MIDSMITEDFTYSCWWFYL